MKSQTRTVLALAVRVSLALATWTFFQPDEYFQSLEVAHHLVFGYGQLTWEWTSERPIRSILYPALNVPIYWLLRILTLDRTKLLVCTYLRLADLDRSFTAMNRFGRRRYYTAFWPLGRIYGSMTLLSGYLENDTAQLR